MPAQKTTLAALALALVVLASLSALGSRAAGEPPLLGPFKDNFTLLQPPLPAPSAGFKDGTGRTLSLQDFAGRVVLLNFWATWCGPCVVEMPDLDLLQGALGDRGLSVVAVSQDRGGPPVVEQFYKENGLTRLAVYLDSSGRLSQKAGVSGLPTTFLIDRSGQMVGAFEGPAEWNSPEAKALIEHYLPSAEAEVLETGG